MHVINEWSWYKTIVTNIYKYDAWKLQMGVTIIQCTDTEMSDFHEITHIILRGWGW